jgi:hypothetical protein
MANIYTPPAPILKTNKFSVFLAGSIEMGKCYDWQSYVCEKLNDLPIDIYNPRRIAPPEDVPEQIRWELGGLERASLIAMHFEPGGLAPISLLEMGLHMRTGKLVIHCPHGYLRKENVDVTAEFYGFNNFVNSLDDLVEYIRETYEYQK